MTLTADQRRALWRKLNAEVRELESKARDHEFAAHKITAQARELADLRDALMDPCAACDGLGKIRQWIAQDESNVLTCRGCGGTGERGRR